MSLAMRPNELNTEINRLQGAMPSSLFYVKTVDADVSNLNEIMKMTGLRSIKETRQKHSFLQSGLKAVLKKP